jgi:hypothetical protein
LKLGFELEQFKTAVGGLACNEFVFQKNRHPVGESVGAGRILGPRRWIMTLEAGVGIEPAYTALQAAA